jgi:hypothetical protein
MSDRAAEYRKRADECKVRAYGARDPEVHREYLEMAEGWLRLALNVEQQLRRMTEDDD